MSIPLQIAIDGPVAAGKSTVARTLAQQLDITYIDTGAMYRAVGWAAVQRAVSLEDETAVTVVAQDIDIQLFTNGSVHVTVDGTDVTDEIRSDEIGQAASKIAVYKPVRQALVSKQQAMAAATPVVMEGRDICSVVLPDATLKIYLDADISERVERYRAKMAARGERMTSDAVRESIQARDAREMNRAVDPLRPTDDAWIFDTTGLSLEEVVTTIERRLHETAIHPNTTAPQEHEALA